MPIDQQSISAIERITMATKRALERTVQARKEARARWIEYLRNAQLNEFGQHFKTATASSGTTVVWPTELLAPALPFSIVQFFQTEGLGLLNARISFIWHEPDFSVVRVEHGGDSAPVRYDLEQFLSEPLETQVVKHLATALLNLQDSLLQPPAEK